MDITLPTTIYEKDELYRKIIPISHERTCNCKPNHLNCLTPKEWVQAQIGVWQFSYEKRDIRDKNLHPATFPLSLSKKVIELFTHEGELVIDPFVGSGTTLVMAKFLNRNAIGFDLKKEYINLCASRISMNSQLFNSSNQIAVHDNAKNIPKYIEEETVSLIWTSPPYANLLNQKRKNKSRKNRKNEQYERIEQYSQSPNDLGNMEIDQYIEAIGDIFESLLPLLKHKGHCVINISDIWHDNKRIPLHSLLIEELNKRKYELKNIIIWDKTNIVNGVGIFGWPSNYITMGITFEYLLDFWRPEKKRES